MFDNNRFLNLENSFKHELGIIETQQKTSKEYFLESLESTLKKAAPNPELLDVRISLIIPNYQVYIDSYFLKPTNSINSFKDNLYEIFLKKNDPIISLDEFNVYLLALPKILMNDYKESIEKIKNTEVKEIETVLNEIKSKENEINIGVSSLANNNLFASLKLKPGDCLYFFGNFKLKSHLPAQCMSYKFEKDSVVDYYFCSDCKINCNKNIQ